jgi:hypothetical protein
MGIVQKSTSVENFEDDLTKEEYEFIFWMIKNSTFKGENIEFLYNLITKLQNQYLGLKKD